MREANKGAVSANPTGSQDRNDKRLPPTTHISSKLHGGKTSLPEISQSISVSDSTYFAIHTCKDNHQY